MVPHAEVDCIFLESPVWSVGRGGKKYGLSKKEVYKRVTWIWKVQRTIFAVGMNLRQDYIFL